MHKGREEDAEPPRIVVDFDGFGVYDEAEPAFPFRAVLLFLMVMFGLGAVIGVALF